MAEYGGRCGWQYFATKNRLALVGVRLTDKPHEQSFIELYVNVSQGSGQALLTALGTFVGPRQTSGTGICCPCHWWGCPREANSTTNSSPGSPSASLAFVVNKGGIYYTALVPAAARSVPGILFIGGKDLDSRIHIITRIFSVNRRGERCGPLLKNRAPRTLSDGPSM